MEEQSGREFASSNSTVGAQDATLQERGLSPEVSLNPRRRLQHFQRPTPSHVSSISPRATRRGNDHVARGPRGGLKIRKGPDRSRSSNGNVTVPPNGLARVGGAHVDLLKYRRASYPARDHVTIIPSVKAGLRACDIARPDWSMVFDARGHVSRTNLIRLHGERIWRRVVTADRVISNGLRLGAPPLLLLLRLHGASTNWRDPAGSPCGGT